MWLDAARALADYYRSQGKHVTLLANAGWKSWAAEFGIFDEVLGLEDQRFRRNLRYRFEISRRIRQAGFETVVQAAYTRLLAGGDSVVRMTGARNRIGHIGTFEHGLGIDRMIGDPWYTSLIPTDPDLQGEMLRNAAFVRALTGTGYKAKVANLRTSLTLAGPEALDAELCGRPYFVLFPGATFAGRLWPVERYLELAKRLHASTGWVGVICGGRSESEQAALMCARSEAPLLNWVGRTSLTQLAAVLAKAVLLAGNETSAVHIAAAVGTPTVCIVGGGHYGRFMPYSVEETDERPLPVAAAHRMPCFHCNWRCVYHPAKGSPVPCIEEVSVNAAWEAVEAALATTPKRPAPHRNAFAASQLLVLAAP